MSLISRHQFFFAKSCMAFFLRHFVVTLIVITFTSAVGTDCFASCGDWLAEPNSPKEEHSAMDASEETERTIPTQETPQRRCHGPECRQAPTAPVQPLPVEIYAPSNDAYLRKASRDQDSASGLISACKLSNDAALRGYRNVLDRPPQFDL